MEELLEKEKVKGYLAYKDSGEEWLGEIPVHWKTRRIKHLFKEINERSVNGNEDLLSVSQYTGVRRKSDNTDDGELLTTASTLEGYKKVYKGDLVSNIMLAWNGSLGFSPFDGITSPAYSIYRLLGDNNKRYFHYLLRTELYKAEFKRNSSGVIESRLRLYTDDFFRIISILPPINEQNSIANFLDSKTALIDKAIGIKEKQIELLKERRQILIHQAVTRGINPNVKLKDSGVEWIGEIPEHWEVKRIKHLIYKSFSGGTPSTDKLDYWDGGIPWVSSGDVKSNYLNGTSREISYIGLLRSSSNLAPKGSVIFVTRSGILQHTFAISILEKEMAINQDIKCLILTKLISPEYFQKIIQGNNSRILVETRQQAATVESINMNAFYNLFIPLPPIEEQDRISQHIESITLKIATAISLKEQEIEKLKEYKAVLINEAVTGKIKVN